MRKKYIFILVLLFLILLTPTVSYAGENDYILYRNPYSAEGFAKSKGVIYYNQQNTEKCIIYGFDTTTNVNKKIKTINNANIQDVFIDDDSLFFIKSPSDTNESVICKLNLKTKEVTLLQSANGLYGVDTDRKLLIYFLEDKNNNTSFFSCDYDGNNICEIDINKYTVVQMYTSSKKIGTINYDKRQKLDKYHYTWRMNYKTISGKNIPLDEYSSGPQMFTFGNDVVITYCYYGPYIYNHMNVNVHSRNKCAVYMKYNGKNKKKLYGVTNNEIKKTTNKDKGKVSYTLKGGVLTIKGKGRMPESMNFKNNKKIKKVVIGDRITSISGKAFYNCKNLKSVIIGKSVVRIGYYAFYGTSIKKLTIPKNVKVIGDDAFGGMKLSKIKMPGSITCDPYGEDIDYNPTFISNSQSIEFTTDLDISMLDMIKSENYKVSKRDSNYTSIDGIVYSKDLKKVEYIPNREKIVIAEGLEVFDVRSIGRGLYDYGGIHHSELNKVKEIILPRSVTKVECESMETFNLPKKLKRIEFLNKDIDRKYIRLMKDCIEVDNQGRASSKNGIITIKHTK